jgi:hypothetical protein
MSSFSHAGVSKQDGKFKVRFANDSLRTKVLIKNGHTDIDIIELKHPMTKPEAVDYLLSIDFDNGNKEVRAALEAAQDKRTEAPKAANKSPAKKEAKKAPKPKAPKATKPSMDAIKAKADAAVKAKAISEMEDAPY